MTPQELINDYKAISIVPCTPPPGDEAPAGVTEALRCSARIIAVDQYKSSAKNDPDRMAAYDDLRCFLNRIGHYKGGQNGATHSYAGSTLTSPQLGGGKSLDVSTRALQRSYVGKGLPDDFQKVLTLVDLYLAMADLPRKMRKRLEVGGVRIGVQAYADTFLGIDCNGFAGAYLALAHPHLDCATYKDKDMEEPVPSRMFDFSSRAKKFETKASSKDFTRIDDPAEITQGCLLVDFRKWLGPKDNSQHVAVVESVTIHETGPVIMRTAESSGSKGGLYNREGTLSRFHRPAKFRKTIPANPGTGEEEKKVWTEAEDNDHGYWKLAGFQFKYILKPNPSPV